MNQAGIEKGVLKVRDWLGSGGPHFEVPVYQRLFTWEKPQFERLLDDLEGAGNRPHHLGIVTVVKKGDSLVLIDGQQRLTALAILASLLGTETDSVIEQIGERLSYAARPDDARSLAVIWENGQTWMKTDDHSDVKNSLESIVTNTNMRELVLAILERIRQKAKLDVDALVILVAKLPKVYEDNLNLQNEYFEKMNSSGKQLEPHEVLKVRLCKTDRDYRKWNAIEDFTDAYQEPTPPSWESKEESGEISFFEAAEAPAKVESKEQLPEKWRAAPIDWPMFLRHVHALCSSDGNLDVRTSLLKLFKEKPRKGDYLTTMEAYRKFLDTWIIHIARDGSDNGNEAFGDESNFKYWTNANETVFAMGTASGIGLSRMLKQLEMVLYALEDERQEWLLKVFDEARTRGEVAQEWLAERLAANLTQGTFDVKRLEGETWPDDYLSYGQHPRVQLACLDFFLWALWTSEDESDRHLKEDVFGHLLPDELKAIEKYVPRAHRSVEHFHPQKDDNSTNISAWSETDAATGNRLKDIFGNLALISTGRNSQYGNLGVAGKSERIDRLVEKCAIESIKLLLMRAECRDGTGQFDDKRWTPNQARAHAQKMAGVIRWGLSKLANIENPPNGNNHDSKNGK